MAAGFPARKPGTASFFEEVFFAGFFLRSTLTVTASESASTGAVVSPYSMMSSSKGSSPMTGVSSSRRAWRRLSTVVLRSPINDVLAPSESERIAACCAWTRARCSAACAARSSRASSIRSRAASPASDARARSFETAPEMENPQTTTPAMTMPARRTLPMERPTSLSRTQARPPPT